jgi:hypothetical protein
MQQTNAAGAGRSRVDAVEGEAPQTRGGCTLAAVGTKVRRPTARRRPVPCPVSSRGLAVLVSGRGGGKCIRSLREMHQMTLSETNCVLRARPSRR